MLPQTYVLELNNNKYFVGKTNNYHKVFVSKEWPIETPWCLENGIKRMLILVNGNYAKELTLLMMSKFGCDNVRGHAWRQKELKKPPLAIQHFETLLSAIEKLT